MFSFKPAPNRHITSEFTSSARAIAICIHPTLDEQVDQDFTMHDGSVPLTLTWDPAAKMLIVSDDWDTSFYDCETRVGAVDAVRRYTNDYTSPMESFLERVADHLVMDRSA